MTKVAAAGAFAFAADRYLTNNPNITSNAYFAGSVAAGIAAGTVIGPMLGAMAPQVGTMYNTQSLATRAVEIGSGVGVTWAIYTYVLGIGSDLQQDSQRWRAIGIIAAADVVGEYAADFWTAQPLQYLESR